VTIDKADVRNQIENYVNSLQRYLALTGMSAKTLAPQVSDPSSQIDKHLEAICIQLGIPKRIFMGSERGELASSQDDASWNDRLKARQQGYITPRIIVPFVDRLIAVGVLPEPNYVEPVEEDLFSEEGYDEDQFGADSGIGGFGREDFGQVDKDDPGYSVESESEGSGDSEELLLDETEDVGEDQRDADEEEEDGRPDLFVKNAFCPTGEGGGKDNSCGSSEGGQLSPVKDLQVYHGGSSQPGELVTYYTTDKSAAGSYVDMYNERVGGGGSLHESKLTLDNPAPVDVISDEAKSLGFDEVWLGSASIFDANIQDEDAVRQLVSRLQKRGFDGAILPDVPYGGDRGEFSAYVKFSKPRSVNPMMLTKNAQFGQDEEQPPFGEPESVQVKKGYTVSWPDLDSNTDLSKAQIASTKTQALAAYVSGNVESVMPLLEFYTKILSIPEEEAVLLVKAAEEQQLEQEQEQLEQQQQFGMEQQFGADQGMLPEGSGEELPFDQQVANASKIKSASGNRGTFDPNDPIITHSQQEGNSDGGEFNG
jgi:hypothetical protein